MKIRYLLLLAILAFNFIKPFPVFAQSEQCPLIAGFWVEEGLANFLKQRYNVNFDDWAQLQIDAWNKILKEAGVKDCYRRRAPIHVKDGTLPIVPGLLPTNCPNASDRTIDVQWGFTAKQQDITFWDKVMKNWSGVDWGLIHELSHARYLVDEYRNDIYSNQIEIKDPIRGELIVGRYLPIMQYNLVYLNKSQDIMSSHNGNHFYGEYSARALNRIAGQHLASIVGACSPPANIGIYLNNLPEKNYLQILDIGGKPLVSARVRIFQSTHKPNGGFWDKWFDNHPDITGTTDDNGVIDITENPFGYVTNRKIFQSDAREKIPYSWENSMFLLEVLFKDQLFYRFMEVADFNYAFWDGAVKQATFRIRTNIKNEGFKELPRVESPDIIISPKVIDSINPQIVIEGKGFGDQPNILSLNRISVGINQVLKTNIISWTDKKIVASFEVPPTAYRFNEYEALIYPFDGQKILVSKEKLTAINPANGSAQTVSAAPTPTLTSTPQASLSQIMISNYNDFRENNNPGDKGNKTQTIRNFSESRELDWILSTESPNNPVYIEEVYGEAPEQSFKIYDISLKEGETSQIGNITIKAKVIKVPISLVINGNEVDFPSSDEDKIKVILTQEQQNLTQFDIPIQVKYSDGTSNFLIKHINIKSTFNPPSEIQNEQPIESTQETNNQLSVPESLQPVQLNESKNEDVPSVSNAPLECNENQEKCVGDQSWFCVDGKWVFDEQETNNGECRPLWRCEENSFRKFNPPSDSSGNFQSTDEVTQCPDGCHIIYTQGYKEDAECN